MRAIVVIVLLARAAAAEPALDTAATALLPGTVPLRLVAGAMVDHSAGSASFDAGTTRFEVRVRRLGARFDGQLDLVALIDASERGIDIDTARVDRIDGRVVVVPRATPNPVDPLALVELAYVPWNREATLIMIYSDAATEWQQLAGQIILATQVEPSVTIEHVGPYVMSVPRAWTVIHHAAFDELVSRDDRCVMQSSDAPMPRPSQGVTDLSDLWPNRNEEEWSWETSGRLFFEFTNSDAGVRIRCETVDMWAAMMHVLDFVQSGRRAPRIPALVRIHSLLVQSS